MCVCVCVCVIVMIHHLTGPSLDLRVPNTATVSQVIEEYTKRRRKGSNIGPTKESTYSLLIAEVRGSLSVLSLPIHQALHVAY